MSLHPWQVAEYLEMWEENGVEISPRHAETLTQSLLQDKPAPAPGPPTDVSNGGLESIRTDMGDCQRCRLCEARKEIVFGVGNSNADLMFVGEGPGADEDESGTPFVGRAGQLLDKIIVAMKLQRETVYIANVVKCRPPENRTPLPDEVGECGPFLKAQIEAIQPKIIVALGLPAAQFLTGQTESMGSLRGKFASLGWETESPVKVMPTYHPAYLLRTPSAKATVWEDMKKVMADMGGTQ